MFGPVIRGIAELERFKLPQLMVAVASFKNASLKSECAGVRYASIFAVQRGSFTNENVLRSEPAGMEGVAGELFQLQAALDDVSPLLVAKRGVKAPV